MKPKCFNRDDYQPGYFAPNGFGADGKRRTVWVEHTMSLECKQHEPEGEATIHGWDCEGCRHKPEVNSGAA